MQPQAAGAGVELKLLVNSPNIWVPADGDRLKQAFGNLVDNALKHTPAGGRVQIDVTGREHEVEVLVRDNGRGIPAEYLPRVMDRFDQVDKSRSSFEGRSAGLGLAIAREVVRLHRGEMSIQSGIGKGTVVRVMLPVVPGVKAQGERSGVLKRLGGGGRSVKTATLPAETPGNVVPK